MTRGKLVLIENNGVWTSDEYNGDMYYECHGQVAVAMLKKVSNLSGFANTICRFNKCEFGYADYDNSILENLRKLSKEFVRII